MPKEIYDPQDSNMCITMHVDCLTVAVTAAVAIAVAVAVAVAVTETESIGTTAMVKECCLQSVSPSSGFTTCACRLSNSSSDRNWQYYANRSAHAQGYVMAHG